MRIVEINGIKLEIDERTARTVESYRVGDRIKVLVKEYSAYAVYPGVIVGFSDFKDLPTIDIMYVTRGYGAEFRFISINAQSTETGIAPSNEAEVLLDKQGVMNELDRQERQAEVALADIRKKREYFTKRFAAAFGETAQKE